MEAEKARANALSVEEKDIMNQETRAWIAALPDTRLAFIVVAAEENTKVNALLLTAQRLAQDATEAEEA